MYERGRETTEFQSIKSEGVITSRGSPPATKKALTPSLARLLSPKLGEGLGVRAFYRRKILCLTHGSKRP
jgi:hypothetical protein